LERKRHNEVLSVGVRPKLRPVKKQKRTEIFVRQTGYFPYHPRRHKPLKVCMRGRVLEVVIYLKFHENRSRGLGAVEGRKSPSPVDLARGLYSSLYYRTSRDAFTSIQFQKALSVFEGHRSY